MQGIAFSQHIEDFDTCTDHGRSNRIGEQIRATALAQQVDNLFASGGESAHGSAKSLAQCTGVNIHTSVSFE